MKALLKHAFEEMNINRFWLDVYPDNIFGIRLYESLGMNRDGVLRQSYKSERGYLKSDNLFHVKRKVFFKKEETDMLRLAEMKDMTDWIRLNREFMDFEIQDNNLWNNIDLAENEELAEVFAEALKSPENIAIFMIEDDDKTIGFANLVKNFQRMVRGLRPDDRRSLPCR